MKRTCCAIGGHGPVDCESTFAWVLGFGQDRQAQTAGRETTQFASENFVPLVVGRGPVGAASSWQQEYLKMTFDARETAERVHASIYYLFFLKDSF